MNDIPQALPVEDIEVDTACLHCGYNLRGLRVDGLCPECGSPIGRSVLGNFLRYSDVDWLQTVGRGTTLKLWAIGLYILLGLVGGVVGALAAAPNIIVIPALIAAALSVWGAWLITTPEPRMALREDPVTLRKAVRVCAVLAFFGGLFSNSESLASSADEKTILLVIGGMLSLAGIVQYFGELVYFRRFARRVPNPSLERSTTTVLWGLPICYGVLLVSGLIVLLSALISGGNVGSAPGTAAGGAVPLVSVSLACGAGVGMLVLGIWYIVLLFSYRRVFLTAAQEAIQWQHGGGRPADSLRR